MTPDQHIRREIQDLHATAVGMARLHALRFRAAEDPEERAGLREVAVGQMWAAAYLGRLLGQPLPKTGPDTAHAPDEVSQAVKGIQDALGEPVMSPFL